MKNKLNTAIAALFVATASMAAMATEVGGTYVTAGVMKVTYDGLNALAQSGVTIDDEDTATTFTVGYQLDENLSLEAGVIGSSDVSANLSGGESGTLYGKAYSISGSITVKAETDTSYTLGAKYSSPVSENFDLYGKAGFLFWDLTGTVALDGTLTYDSTTYTVSGSSVFYTKDGSDPYYGVGGSYKLSQDTSINLDYLKMKVDDEDVDGLSLAIGFDF
jgi:outer membrane protein W